MRQSRTLAARAAAIAVCARGRRGVIRRRLDASEQAARQTIDPGGYGWYALRVQPGKERVTRLLLSDWGLPAWTPLEHRHQRASRYTRRLTTRKRILLVGYVLIGLPRDPRAMAGALGHALRLNTVTGVVTSDGQPARLERAEVERLMVVDRGEVMRLPQPGDRLELVDGPLAELLPEDRMVELREIRGTQALVLTRLFGGREVQVPLARLAVA